MRLGDGLAMRLEGGLEDGSPWDRRCFDKGIETRSNFGVQRIVGVYGVCLRAQRVAIIVADTVC